MVSALQPFVQTKIEPCTLKLKFCLEIARVPLKMAARISYICLRSWRYNKAVFFIENTCTFYWELILPLSKILFFLKGENFLIWVKTVCFWACSCTQIFFKSFVLFGNYSIKITCYMLSTFLTSYKLKSYVCDVNSPFHHKCHKTQAILVGAIIPYMVWTWIPQRSAFI